MTDVPKVLPLPAAELYQRHIYLAISEIGQSLMDLGTLLNVNQDLERRAARLSQIAFGLERAAYRLHWGTSSGFAANPARPPQDAKSA